MLLKLLQRLGPNICGNVVWNIIRFSGMNARGDCRLLHDLNVYHYMYYNTTAVMFMHVSNTV